MANHCPQHQKTSRYRESQFIREETLMGSCDGTEKPELK
jgi:hypothetical protein